MNLHDPQAIRARLPRTWGAFFARHGSFTPIQRMAIPVLLEGDNALLCAATASGKTEACLAPLIERHIPASRAAHRLRLLVLLPTRALITDLATRLEIPLNGLRITCAVKSHDFNTFHPQYPADVLLTTPEALDALLCNAPRSLVHVCAVVIDELHALDESVRGDHLQVLLNRLRALRAYAVTQRDTDAAHIQFVGLSATLADPVASAARYFSAARVISHDNQRPIHANMLPLDPQHPTNLLACLNTFRQHRWKKAIVFCNTRAEVEFYAAQVRQHPTPFGQSIYVHYSNLERDRRREIEQLFANAEAAVCFASSTLELGIDIGSVDVVLLIGAPGNRQSFVQRIGRGSRRAGTTQAVCFYRSPLEAVLFEVLLTMQTDFALPAAFRPSVVVQQIFSLLKASPTGAIRLAPTAALLAGRLHTDAVEMILGGLQAARYLKTRRAGEWCADDLLNRLVDVQNAEHAPLSLYSNIQNTGNTIKIRDRNSQRVIATVDSGQFNQETILLEGRPLQVEWYDGHDLWVSATPTHESVMRPSHTAAQPVLRFELAQSLPAHFGLVVTCAPLIHVEEGWLCFHWLGDIYGRTLIALLRPTMAVEATSQSGLCLLLVDPPRVLPILTAEVVTRYVQEHYRQYEPLLALGAYHSLLPLELRRSAVVAGFDVTRFVNSVRALSLEESVAAPLIVSLTDLLNTTL